jgi:hypothetical protein
MNRRTLTTMALLCSAVVFAAALPQAALAQSNPVGTWNVNLAKSTYSPGPPPRSNTQIVEAVGQGFRSTVEGIDAQGNPTKVVVMIFYDGKSYPVTGAPYDAISFKQINESTTESIRTKAGKVVQTATNVLSADGKTMTRTITGVNEKGQQINNVVVFDKQ